MQKITKIETERLVLRNWREEDAEALFEINNDEKVIEFLPKALTRQECQNFINKENAQIAQQSQAFAPRGLLYKKFFKLDKTWFIWVVAGNFLKK